MTDLLTENARLRAALEWYGEQARLCRLIHREGDAGRHALAGDGGKRARAALATPAPDAVQEAARDYRIMAKAVRQAIDIFAYAEGDGGCGKTAVEMWLMDGKALRAIAGDRT